MSAVKGLLQNRMSQEDWARLQHYSGGACTCCGYSKELTVDRSPEGRVRGLVCAYCADDLGRIDAGELEAEGCCAEYLESPWHLTD